MPRSIICLTSFRKHVVACNVPEYFNRTSKDSFSLVLTALRLVLVGHLCVVKLLADYRIFSNTYLGEYNIFIIQCSYSIFNLHSPVVSHFDMILCLCAAVLACLAATARLVLCNVIITWLHGVAKLLSRVSKVLQGC